MARAGSAGINVGALVRMHSCLCKSVLVPTEQGGLDHTDVARHIAVYVCVSHAQVGSDHTDLARQGLEPPPNEQVGFHPSPCTSYAGMGWRARWFRQQRGITRYNCADSLDRTNVGSFFGAIQVRTVYHALCYSMPDAVM